MDWYGIKVAIVDLTGLDRAALHLLGGFSAHLLFAMLLRRPVSSWLPWILVCIVGVANEWFDLGYEAWPDRQEQWNEAYRDMATTLALPSLLILLGRFAPHLLVRPRRADDMRDAGAGQEPAGD